MEKPDRIDLQKELSKHWGIEPSGEDSWEELKRNLKARLKELLNDEFNQLVNAMYRLDVSEARFNQALSAGNQDAIAEQLTEIVLNRELQRLETRRKYKDR